MIDLFAVFVIGSWAAMLLTGILLMRTAPLDMGVLDEPEPPLDLNDPFRHWTGPELQKIHDDYDLEQRARAGGV